MSNLANYSPYNKTYKFLLFQNQAYHERNKRNASPCIKTNLRHSYSRHSPIRDPEKYLNINLSQKQLESTQRCESPSSSRLAASVLFKPTSEIQNAVIESGRRVIHKNLSYEKFRGQRVSQQNIDLVSRLLAADCQVVNSTKAEKSFERHKKYQNIRTRYNQHGQRKDSLSLGNRSLLCPTLSQFHQSGLASKFLELDLSMSVKPSTSRSFRKTPNPSPAADDK